MPQIMNTNTLRIINMKVKYIVTILLVSLILTGCGDKKQATNNDVELDNFKVEVDDMNEKEIEDWQIYENKELGIEFKYPKDWHYKKDTDKTEQELYLGLAKDEKILEQGVPYPIEFIVVGLNVEMTFEEYLHIITEKDGLRYVLAGESNYQDKIEQIAESFEFTNK